MENADTLQAGILILMKILIMAFKFITGNAPGIRILYHLEMRSGEKISSSINYPAGDLKKVFNQMYNDVVIDCLKTFFSVEERLPFDEIRSIIINVYRK
jgi:hypothetical protein